MRSVDLSAYAGLILFGLFAICAVFYYLNYKIGGKDRGIATVFLAFAGMAIALWIVRMADFSDASPETVLTISIGTIIVPLIYTISTLYKWIVRQKEEGAEANLCILRKIKKGSFICIGIAGIIAFLVAGSKHQTKKMEMNTESILMSYGVESFYDEYMNNLRMASGLSDLDMQYSVDKIYYNQYGKMLELTIHIENFVSKEIDRYFTTTYNEEDGIRLASMLEAMRRKFTQWYTYELETVGSVSVSIYGPEYEFSVMTPVGREYRYSYGYVDSQYIEIDGDGVYYSKTAGSHENSWSPSYGAIYDIPYDGMNASQISQTRLGPPDEVQKCLDYDALRPERRSIKYRWYDDKGGLEFTAYALAGKVISVTDFRN